MKNFKFGSILHLKITFVFKFQKIVLNMRILIFCWATLQLVQNIKPIRILFCTTGSCSDLSIYLIYNIYKFHQTLRTLLDSLPSLHSLTHSLTPLTPLTHFTINFCRVDPLRATHVDD